MDDRANRAVAKPPIGSVNNQPTYSVRDLEAQVWRELAESRRNADQLGPVGITVLLVFCTAAIVAGVMHCPVR